MRHFAVLAAATLLVAQPIHAQEDFVWPTPEISSDLSVLPKRARATYEALVAAARTGDVENLRAIMARQEYPPTVSYGAPDDPIAFLKDVSEDPEGRQILGLLLDLLDQPFAYYPGEDSHNYYVWPYLAELPPHELTPEQTVDAYRLLNAEQLQELRDLEAWYYWRVYIGADGEWGSFVAGD